MNFRVKMIRNANEMNKLQNDSELEKEEREREREREKEWQQVSDCVYEEASLTMLCKHKIPYCSRGFHIREVSPK